MSRSTPMKPRDIHCGHIELLKLGRPGPGMLPQPTDHRDSSLRVCRSLLRRGSRSQCLGRSLEFDHLRNENCVEQERRRETKQDDGVARDHVEGCEDPRGTSTTLQQQRYGRELPSMPLPVVHDDLLKPCHTEQAWRRQADEIDEQRGWRRKQEQRNEPKPQYEAAETHPEVDVLRKKPKQKNNEKSLKRERQRLSISTDRIAHGGAVQCGSAVAQCFQDNRGF
mmetsp:Transcript_22941/g.60383  ORF Transcript_22941/g.60383 Transcript_22941/m.60383 type:complete len:224 (-) Transcript_22941:147-818(-)|eukprot:CAMPEP_0194489304 /NCGR_PEP_ID=MMETSP0253-20130528/8893_1 /TAXON_ID=2966 /ORGANISM="Noctiluca scintillans" /LENGTH=223 /DNA_ID=CAMNT_0039329749 /DNA_START=362 /DNA_END=1033 /DNA_ORIENTATION=+